MSEVARTICIVSLCLGLILFALYAMNPRYDWVYAPSMWLLGISVGALLVPLFSNV